MSVQSWWHWGRLISWHTVFTLLFVISPSSSSDKMTSTSPVWQVSLGTMSAVISGLNTTREHLPNLESEYLRCNFQLSLCTVSVKCAKQERAISSDTYLSKEWLSDTFSFLSSLIQSELVISQFCKFFVCFCTKFATSDMSCPLRSSSPCLVQNWSAWSKFKKSLTNK